VSLSLLQDPAGLIMPAILFCTPVFCCQQVQGIADFVQMNVRNGGAEDLSHGNSHLPSVRLRQHPWSPGLVEPDQAS
jgi:hypothetical protein